MIKKCILYICILLLVILINSNGCTNIDNTRNSKLIKEGNEVVEKIEKYRQEYGKLPSALTDIGLEEQEGMYVLYYYKRDSTHYTVSFPISGEEHKFYYSDSKKWENGYRDMK